jgi:uncharacterized membrane protein YeaQ/YmgE (transglycosylase-associated protein family)
MKLLTITCAFSMLFLQTVKSQDSLKPVNSQDAVLKPTVYKAYIYQPHLRSIRGYLVTIKDSSLFLSQNKIPLSFANANLAYSEKFDYKSIQKVKLSRPKVLGRSILIGAIAGIIAGAIIGYASGDDSGWFALTAADKAVVGGLIGAGAGTLIGASIGREAEKKFLINGDWKSLEEMKESLQNNK